MWANMGDKPLQLVGVRDIGIFARDAFASPDAEQFKNSAISLAGDELTQAQANEIFWKVFGRPMPMAYSFVGTLLQRMVPEVGVMFKWFVEHGYGADLHQLRLINGNMRNFEDYLREDSGFKR
jgi:hypothetical protein